VRLAREAHDARVAEPAARPSGRAAAAGARPQLDAVFEYIERHLARPISRQDLARQASFAPSYFSALFREATGTTIPEYINGRRVARAQELLRQPQTRVSAVCYAVGFRDLSNFNRVFKRLAGQTPREYRRSVLGDEAEPEGEAEGSS
jgi:AraC family transcriptional regulator